MCSTAVSPVSIFSTALPYVGVRKGTGTKVYRLLAKSSKCFSRFYLDQSSEPAWYFQPHECTTIIGIYVHISENVYRCRFVNNRCEVSLSFIELLRLDIILYLENFVVAIVTMIPNSSNFRYLDVSLPETRPDFFF